MAMTPPSDYYVHKYSGEEIDDAVAMVLRDSPTVWNYTYLRSIVREGKASQMLAVGDQVVVNRATSITASVSGGGITAASVNFQTFLNAVGTVPAGVYSFIYSGGAWKFNGNGVVLSTYGISVTGTPVEGSIINVTVIGSKVAFDIAATDGYDHPADGTLTHALSLISHDILTYDSLPFDALEALVYVDPSTFPSGLAAGTYNIKLDHGAYGQGTAEDGTYQFTTTQVVPAGGFIRHTTMGSWRSSYGKSYVLAGKFVTYDASRTVIESNLATTEGSSGTALGTATSSNPTYRVQTYINFTERNAYGDNNYIRSAMRQWLNSNAASNWWKPSSNFDMRPGGPTAGFLYGLDPDFVAIIGTVKKRTAKSIADGYSYQDTNEKVFLVSNTEINFGATNSVYETGVDSSGNVVTTPYPLYVGATNEDRIKYYDGTPRYWFMRSPRPWLASDVYESAPTGTLDGSGAHYQHGCVSGLCIV